MQAFDRDSFLIDALTKERDRIVLEINELIEDVKNGRAFPKHVAQPTAVAEPGGDGASSVTPDAPREDAPDVGDSEKQGREAGGTDDNAKYHGRSRNAFELRKKLAYQTVAEHGEVPFSVVHDEFERRGLTDRLARSAMNSLRDDDKLYNVKRDNPSDNTWALWDHPSAVNARHRDSQRELARLEGSLDLRTP